MENYSCNSVVRCIFIIIFVPFLLPTRNKDYPTNTEFIMAIAPNEATPQVDLIYKIEDKPSFKDAVFAAFQHLLAIFVAIITPPLIIAGALNLDLETTSFLVSMALFASGVSTFIQCRRVGPLGAGLLCVQGTSFSFIGPIISAGLAGGLPLIFGCTIAAAPVEMIVSRTFRYLKQIITPLVSGIVVLLIGLSLIKVGIISCGGGNAAMSDGTFGNWQNLSIAALVLVSVLFFNKSKNKYIRMSSIVLGLLVGYVLAYILGRVDLSGMETTKIALLNIPVPFKYGLSLNLSSFIAIGLIYLITAIEATGDITANSMISGEPVEGDKYIKRVSGGVLADGFNSLLAGVFNSFPNSIFAQNNGLIQLTGVASRRVGYYIAALLIVLGLFPGIGLIFSLMPDPVLGGATLLMFGTVAAAGIRIIAAQDIDRKATMILAISLSLGLGVELMPDILRNISLDLRGIFSSGITTGGLAAIISNMLIRGK
ncbi:xanthine permease XanP [Porphyromonas gingivalis]